MLKVSYLYLRVVCSRSNILLGRSWKGGFLRGCVRTRSWAFHVLRAPFRCVCDIAISRHVARFVTLCSLCLKL